MDDQPEPSELRFLSAEIARGKEKLRELYAERAELAWRLHEAGVRAPRLAEMMGITRAQAWNIIRRGKP